MSEQREIAIIGAGLVGALNAAFLARRGFNVSVFEAREDIRGFKAGGRSINLALSHRGRSALRAVGLEEKVMAIGVPAYSRFIHNRDGSHKIIPYGKETQHITSIDRQPLNEILIDHAESLENVNFFFQHKLQDLNTATGHVTLQKPNGETFTQQFDLVIGNDGARSVVRQAMIKDIQMNYMQEFIDHSYIEIIFPPTETGDYALKVNHLHIWPRNEFMLMGLPSRNGYVTGTLFMPRVIIETLKTEEAILNFFEENFPDALDLLGRANVLETFKVKRFSTLVGIKCSPYHVADRCLIMGDAAHAIVPFYGQGMNCGFEDVLVLDELMDKFNEDFSRVLPEYTKIRVKDAHAIFDLSKRNYIEMRQSVNTKMFLIRKTMDNLLHRLFPERWVPLYTMVSFTRTPYSKCISDRAWQDKVITNTIRCFGIAILAGSTFVIHRHTSTIFNSKWLHLVTDVMNNALEKMTSRA